MKPAPFDYVAPATLAGALAALGGRRIDPPFTAEKLWRALPEADR